MDNKLTFGPKDASIIKKNPGLTPYQLKEKGLTQAAFNKLMAQPATDINPIADPALGDGEENKSALHPKLPDPPQGNMSEPTGNDKEGVLIPKITSFPLNTRQQLSTNANATSTILPTQVLVEAPSGMRNPLGREFARKLVQQDPRYKIID